MIRLLIGLGDPGPEYEATRHNTGFCWIDEVARKLGASLLTDWAYHGRVARVNRSVASGGTLWLQKFVIHLLVSVLAYAMAR